MIRTRKRCQFSALKTAIVNQYTFLIIESISVVRFKEINYCLPCILILLPIFLQTSQPKSFVIRFATQNVGKINKNIITESAICRYWLIKRNVLYSESFASITRIALIQLTDSATNCQAYDLEMTLERCIIRTIMLNKKDSIVNDAEAYIVLEFIRIT